MNKSDPLRVAVIGAGAQGRVLLETLRHIPGVEPAAICDIWDYHREYAMSRLRAYGYRPRAYDSYQELLDTERGLDAAIIATPDWVHAKQANACMEAGLHVYCEAPMSNSIEAAKGMARTARRTGRLLQIGYQRRSNPRYIDAINRLVLKERLLGRVVTGYAQWNRAIPKGETLGWPRGRELDFDRDACGPYNSMEQFRNWRWYKRFCGGPMASLGSHQTDVFNWVLECKPKAVIASGGADYHTHQECPDNMLCVFEYENEFGMSRINFAVRPTDSHMGHRERFLGEFGVIEVSEEKLWGNNIIRDVLSDQFLWERVLGGGPVTLPSYWEYVDGHWAYVGVRGGAYRMERRNWVLPVKFTQPKHLPHLENFFNAIRKSDALNCPPETGLLATAAALIANEAMRTGEKVRFAKEDFAV